MDVTSALLRLQEHDVPLLLLELTTNPSHDKGQHFVAAVRVAEYWEGVKAPALKSCPPPAVVQEYRVPKYECLEQQVPVRGHSDEG